MTIPIKVYSTGSFSTIINGKEWRLEEVQGQTMNPIAELPLNFEWDLNILTWLGFKKLVVVNGELSEEVKKRIERVKYWLTTSKTLIYQDAKRTGIVAPRNWAYRYAIIEDKCNEDKNALQMMIEDEKKGILGDYPF